MNPLLLIWLQVYSRIVSIWSSRICVARKFSRAISVVANPWLRHRKNPENTVSIANMATTTSMSVKALPP